MVDILLLAKILLLLLIANGAPIIARQILQNFLNAPIDGNRRLNDGYPIFGPTKTWRGLIAAFICTTLAASLLDLPAISGAAIGLFAMLGDLLSSFIKRRLTIAPGGIAAGLDQIPEALLPLLAACFWFNLRGEDIVILLAGFLVLEVLLSRILFWLHIRKHPY